MRRVGHTLPGAALLILTSLEVKAGPIRAHEIPESRLRSTLPLILILSLTLAGLFLLQRSQTPPEYRMGRAFLAAAAIGLCLLAGLSLVSLLELPPSNP